MWVPEQLNIKAVARRQLINQISVINNCCLLNRFALSMVASRGIKFKKYLSINQSIGLTCKLSLGRTTLMHGDDSDAVQPSVKGFADKKVFITLQYIIK